MLYLEKTTSAQSVFIPKELKGMGTLYLSIVSTIDRVAYVDRQIVLDLNTSSLYYNVAVALPEDMPEGEYEYTLTDDSKMAVATGVLRVGTMGATPGEYDSEVEYEQYESEQF